MSDRLHSLFLKIRRKFTNEESLRRSEEVLHQMILSEADEARRDRLRKKRQRYRDRRRAAIRRFYAVTFAILIIILILLILLIVRIARGGSGSGKAPEQTTEASAEMTAAETGPAEATQITLSFVGDVTLGTDENHQRDNDFQSTYKAQDASYFLANVRDIFSADDLTVINFEGTLTNSTAREDKKFAFREEPEAVKILTEASVEAASVANNHSSDYGKQSFTDTVDTLNGAGITAFGYDDIQVVDVGGVKVGLTGIYELDQHQGVADQVKTNIASLREKGAQIVIVYFHWGIERETTPDENQVALGHLAIDSGADLVLGSHPHVLQGVEIYNGKPIAYSLGNFLFGGNTNPEDKDTMILQETFTVDDDSVKVSAPTAIPCSISSTSERNNYQPTPLTGDEAARVLKKIEDLSEQVAKANGTTAAITADSETAAEGTAATGAAAAGTVATGTAAAGTTASSASTSETGTQESGRAAAASGGDVTTESATTAASGT